MRQPELRLEVIQGSDAVRAEITGARIAQWQELADRQQKVAVYQGPRFVLTWYEVYEPRYEPLLLLARGDGGELAGVMPLALGRREPRELVFAGAEQAEYAGWVALPEIEDEFPARCIARLHELGLLRQPWHWKRLSPGAGTGWLEHAAVRGRGIGRRVEAQPNAILALGDSNPQRFFAANKANHKRKTNRLRKLGELRLVRLTGETLTDELLECFATLCDIRYLARHGVRPFRDDPLKATFCRRLIASAPDAMLLFALMAGETPVAFHFDIGDKRRAIFCMSPFDPRWGRSSPGKLITDLVVEALGELGMQELDMTPGDDAYKEEVASRHETVHSIRLFPSTAQARAYDLRARALAQAKRVAIGVGITRERAERARRVFGAVRRHGPLGLANSGLRGARRWTWSKDVFCAYRLLPAGPVDPATPAQDEEGLPLREDALADFLGYTESNPWASRQNLMREAIRRIERGEHCFTLIEDGVLLFHGWLQIHPKVIRITEVGMDVDTSSIDAAMYDFWTEPRARGRGIYKRAVRAISRQTFAAGAKQIFFGAMEDNRASRRGILAATGAVPERHLVRRKVFGRTSKWEQPCE